MSVALFLLVCRFPISPTPDPLKILTTTDDQTTWRDQGLPMDRVSIDIAAIVCNSSRWPLVVDPQLQGIAWIKKLEGPRLTCATFGDDNLKRIVCEVVERGGALMLEGATAAVDASLWALVSKATAKRGHRVIVTYVASRFSLRHRH